MATALPKAGYVDGFVIPIPEKNLADYAKIAKKASKVWMKHGALSYYESCGEDLEVPFGRPFTKRAKVKPGETVVFAWITYKSRAHRDSVNAKVMADPALHDMDKEMPFDMKRMSFGGFKILVTGKS